jgi:hypothetical protein
MAKSLTEKVVPDPAVPGYAEAMQHQCTLLACGLNTAVCPAADWEVGP